MNLRPQEYEALPGIPFWTDEDNPLSKADVIIWFRYHLAIERLSMGIV
jgi:hypothetical protein